MKKKLDPFENDLLEAYEKGELRTVVSSTSDFEKYRVAARETFVKDRRVNIRLSSPDLMDIQARALEEGIPYQTLIASVLHKYISGRLIEEPSRLKNRSTEGKKKQHGAPG